MLGMPLATAGMIYSLALMMRAIAEPLAGIVSDQMETRWGKRKPFFVVGAPLVLLSFLALWYPYSLNPQALFAVSLISALAYGLISGTMMTPYAAMAPDIVTDYHGRTRLSNIRHLFQLIILTVTIVTFSYYFSGEPEALPSSYVWVVLGFAILFSFPFTLLSLFIEEKHHEHSTAPWPEVFKRLLIPFKLKDFRVYSIMNASIEVVLILLPALFPFYLKFYLHSFEKLPYYALSLGCGAFLAVFILMKFGKRWCKINIFRGSVVLAIGIMLALAWLKPGNQLMANSLFFLLGFVVAGTSSARLSMLTDLAEVVSKTYYTACQGTCFAMAKAVAQSLAGCIMLIIFQLTDLREEGANIPVDGAFVKNLMIIPCLIFLATALLATVWYSLNEKNYLKNGKLIDKS